MGLPENSGNRFVYSNFIEFYFTDDLSCMKNKDQLQVALKTSVRQGKHCINGAF